MLVFDLPSFPVRVQGHQGLLPAAEGHHARADQEQVPARQARTTASAAWPTRWSTPTWPSRGRASSDELVAELKHFCASLLEEDGDALVIRHLYIERRMIPLNIYLQERDAGADRARGGRVRQRHQGPGGGQHLPRRHAVEELRRHAPRQGGVLRLRRDRVHHRLQLPPACPRRATRRKRCRGEIWYRVGPKDVFPETFGPFLLGNASVREVFMKHHADLLDAAFWQGHKERILAGHVHDVFPYEPHKRFRAPQPATSVPVTAPDPPQGAHHVRLHRHRLRRPHADRRPARRLLRARGLGARRRGDQGRGRARRRARRRHRRSADGQLPDGRPGPGAGAPGDASAPACPTVDRRRHAEQDVRHRHARDDVRARHARCRQRQRDASPAAWRA